MCKINCMEVDIELVSYLENKIINGELLNEEESFYFLSYVVFKVRCLLSDYMNEDVRKNSFRNMCNRAQAMLKYYFDSLGLKNIPVQTNKIFFNVIQHSFVIVYLPTENGIVSYIVDPTYNQFFGTGEDYFVFSGEYIRKTPSPGYLVAFDSDIIQNVLRFGFVRLDKDSAKEYGDSFYLTQIGITKKEHDNLFVSGNSYIKFFEKSDVQVNKSVSDLETEGLLLETLKNEKNRMKSV